MYTYADLANEVKRRSTRDQGGTQFDVAIKNIINTSLFRVAREAYWRVLRREDSFDTEADYSEGTGAAAVTEDSTTVTVTGATFITDGIQVGRRVELGGSSKLYTIETITGETTFTVNVAYDGDDATDEDYKIYGKETYVLPAQTGRVALVWHEEDGYSNPMEYVPRTEFIKSFVTIPEESTPTHYTMWEEDMILQQPNEASVVTIASSSTTDTAIDVVVYGIVSGYPDSEKITTNSSDGTTASAGSKSFTKIDRIVKDAATIGRITCTTNTAGVTVSVLPTGDRAAGLMYKKIKMWPLPDSVFPVNIMYYKDPYRLVDDEDVHEMGHQFDESIILLSVAKIKYQENQKEGDRFSSMYMDEVRSLKKINSDKLDWLPSLNRQRDNPKANRTFLHKHLSYLQIGPLYGRSG